MTPALTERIARRLFELHSYPEEISLDWHYDTIHSMTRQRFRRMAREIEPLIEAAIETREAAAHLCRIVVDVDATALLDGKYEGFGKRLDAALREWTGDV